MAEVSPNPTRVIVFFVVLPLVVLVPFGTGVLLATQSFTSSRVALVMGSAASTGFLLAPLLAGTWLTYWDPSRSTESRRIFRRLRVAIIATEVVSAVLIVAFALMANAPAWLPVVFIAGGAALLAASVPVGAALRRADQSAAVPDADDLYPPGERRRDIRRIMTAAITTLVGVGGVLIAVMLALDLWDDWLRSLGLCVALSLLVASLVTLLPLFRLGQRARAIVGGDLGRLRTINKVIIGGKKIRLSTEEEAAAIRYAPLAVIGRNYQLVSSVCLFAALGLMQVSRLASGADTSSSSTFALVFLVGLILVIALIVPAHMRYIRNARAYAQSTASARAELASRGEDSAEPH